MNLMDRDFSMCLFRSSSFRCVPNLCVLFLFFFLGSRSIDSTTIYILFDESLAGIKCVRKGRITTHYLCKWNKIGIHFGMRRG